MTRGFDHLVRSLLTKQNYRYTGRHCCYNKKTWNAAHRCANSHSLHFCELVTMFFLSGVLLIEACGPQSSFMLYCASVIFQRINFYCCEDCLAKARAWLKWKDNQSHVKCAATFHMIFCCPTCFARSAPLSPRCQSRVFEHSQFEKKFYQSQNRYQWHINTANKNNLERHTAPVQYTAQKLQLHCFLLNVSRLAN